MPGKTAVSALRWAVVGSLSVRALHASLAATAVLLAVASGAGLVRLLPWLLAPQVPIEVAWPFARALAAVAVETAILLGPAVGFALAAATAVELGEARALFALGQSPRRIALATWPVAAALAVGALLLSAGAGAGAKQPGRFAKELIEQGRLSCEGVERSRSAEVPVVGVTWLCFSDPEAPPRLVGTLPGTGNRASFTATRMVPSDDLRSFEIDDLRLAARGSESYPAVSLGAKRAVVSGLAPWGRPGNLAPATRASMLCATGALLALLAAWLVLQLSVADRALAAALGFAGPVAAFAVLHSLDGDARQGWPYAAVPVVGVAATLAAAGIWRVVRRSVAGHRPG